MKNKTAILVDHILEEKIDICVVTEIWLQDVDSVSIAALSNIISNILLDNLTEKEGRLECCIITLLK